MSTLKLGTVAVTHNSATVIGTGVDWTNVHDGDLFTVSSSLAPWFVSGDAVFTSGHWQLTLSAPFGGATSSGLTYQITSSFSPFYHFILLNYGDGRTDLLQRQFVARLETVLNSMLVPGAEFNLFFTVKKQIDASLKDKMVIPVSLVSLGLTSDPISVTRGWFYKAAPGDDNIDCVSFDTLTASGFNVNLSGPAVQGQVLHCQVIPAPSLDGSGLLSL